MKPLIKLTLLVAIPLTLYYIAISAIALIEAIKLGTLGAITVATTLLITVTYIAIKAIKTIIQVLTIK